MANEIEQLLKTEQVIQKLLEELQTLKGQVGGYDTAKRNLDEVRQSLLGLVERTSKLAELTHSATLVLGKIGTPEIIARSESTRLAITQFAADTSNKVRTVRNLGILALLASVFSLLASLAVLAKLLMATAH